MEKFLGRFNIIQEKMEGQDAFLDALKLPDAAKEALKARKAKAIIISKNSDGSYLHSIDFGDSREESEIRLGEENVVHTMGIERKNLYELEGERLKGKHILINTGVVTTTCKYFQGDFFVDEAEVNGVAMKLFAKKE